jgi:hypothetical protein
MKAIALALILLVGGTAGAAAVDDAFLARLVGDWTGRGTMKTSADAEPERVYCKVTNALADAGQALEQTGRCSLASNSGPIDGTIAAMGSGLYGGTLSSLASRGPAQIAGSLSGDRLELNADFIDTLGGEAARSVIVIDFVGNGYRLTSTRVDGGESYVASEIVFSP